MTAAKKKPSAKKSKLPKPVILLAEKPKRVKVGPAVLFNGDCRTVLRDYAKPVHATVTDPPYELTASKRTKPAPFVEGSPYSRHRVGVNGDNKPVGGFMGKEWDGTGIAFKVELWAEVMRVLKPGGHLLAFKIGRAHV